MNWKELELDQDVKDNRILARMIVFKQQNPDVEVCFLTNDYASVLNATDRNIRTIMPDGQELVRIELKSSIEAKLHATQKELNELKNRLPKLEFGFYNGQELNSVITCPSASSSLHAEVLTKALTDDHTPQQVAHQRTQFDHIVSISKGRASDDQIKQFTKEYDEYLEEFEPALKRKLMSDHGQKCYLAFVIKNTGTAPVTDFRLDLHFPPGTLVIDADDEKKELKIPKEPKPSWMVDPPSAFVKGNPGLNLGNLNLGLPRGVSVLPADFTWRMHMLRAQYEAQATHWGPLCNKTKDSHIVSYRAKKIQHKNHWVMSPIIAYLIPTNKQGFSIDYYISTDEGPKKISGKLGVQWEQVAII